MVLSILSKSSHSVLENGTTLSAPDIKLSVCGMTLLSIITSKQKGWLSHIVPCQSFHYILQCQFRWPYMGRMAANIVPVAATVSVNYDLPLSPNTIRQPGLSQRTNPVVGIQLRDIM